MYHYSISKPVFKFIITAIFSLALIITAAGCKMSGDVLAEYKGGKVTRGQMYEWLEAGRISKEATLKKPINQKHKLKEMVLNTLIVQEAKKEGFDKNENFLKRAADIKRNFNSVFLQKHILKQKKFSEEAVSLRLIKLQIKNFRMDKQKRVELSAGEIAAEAKLKKEAALKIISEYQAGGKFDELAKKYSEDSTRNKGGMTGYITRDKREPEFMDEVFKMKKGELSKEPVKTANAFYIVLVEDRAVLTDENITDIIKDKKIANSMKDELTAKSVSSLVNKLKIQKDVSADFDVVEKGNPAAVIFKAGEIQFTLKNLNDYYAEIEAKGNRQLKKQDDKIRKKQMAQQLFNETLLSNELVRTGLDKTETYQKEWIHSYNRGLASEYKNTKTGANVTVTDQEIKSEYEKNKNRLYVKQEMKGNQPVKTIVPFAEVRASINDSLIRKKKMQSRKMWEEKLLADNSFKIYDDKLEGK